MVEILEDRHSAVYHAFGRLAFCYTALAMGDKTFMHEAFTILKEWDLLSDDGEMFPNIDDEATH